MPRARRTIPLERSSPESCPQQHLHAPHPEGCLAHAAWAEEMQKTHAQQQCPGCGLWAIWVPRCPHDPDHELTPYWLGEDPVEAPPAGVACLDCGASVIEWRKREPA